MLDTSPLQVTCTTTDTNISSLVHGCAEARTARCQPLMDGLDEQAEHTISHYAILLRPSNNCPTASLTLMGAWLLPQA